MPLPPRLVKVQLMTHSFMEGVKDWASVSKLGFLDALREQTKQLGLRLITGPVSRETGNRGIATPPDTKKQGETAVRRDVYRAVFPLKGEFFNKVRERERVNVLISTRDERALRAMVAAGAFGHHLKDATVTAFNPQMHESQRNKRGIVPETAGKHPKFATYELERLEAYVKRKQQNVGMAKGGWAAGVMHLGGKVSAWVRRHAGMGTFIDKLKPGIRDFYFSFINRSPWVDRDDVDRVMHEAMKGREMQMRKDIERILDREWNKKLPGGKH